MNTPWTTLLESDGRFCFLRPARPQPGMVDQELTLAEMLDDDIVRTVMASDRVQRRDVERLFAVQGPDLILSYLQARS